MSGHPIDVDLERILPILAREIYTTPFAFLRENVQNAFDAIRIQRFRDAAAGITRDHRISVELRGDVVSISDTGIGMSRNDLQSLFWSIGKSGKHTREAQSAGVVGTFGIGGMANFGACSRLEVTTRTHASDRAIKCWADRDKLSAKEECVFYEDGPREMPPGTIVSGTLLQTITADAIAQYLKPIVQYLDVPVYVKETQISGFAFPLLAGDDALAIEQAHGSAKTRLKVRALKNGQAQIDVEALTWNDTKVDIRGSFSTAGGVIAAYHHGFMLANVPLSTTFGLGGSLDCVLLRPTAGREAVTDDSRNIVQQILAMAEKALAEHIAKMPELPEFFSAFYRYVNQHGRWDLMGAASIRLYGAPHRVPLAQFRDSKAGHVYFAKDGHDQSIMQAYREQGKAVVILSTDAQRQKGERQFLTSFCSAAPLDDQVTCLRTVNDLPFADLTVKFRLHDKLRKQFLIEDLSLQAGELSHKAMLWVPPKRTTGRMIVFIDFRHTHIKRLISLRDTLSFDAVCDIFIRDYVLPHLESAFPELRQRDFDALLRKLQSSVEFFEIDPNDVRRLQQLAAITNMSPETVAAVLGARRSGGRVATAVRPSDVTKVTDVVQQPSGRSVDEMREEFYVKLLDVETDAKILDATDAAPELGLCRYYLALTSDSHVLYRRVFVERNPSTDFSWGGHRAGYLFYSEGTSVVYYDLQFSELVDSNEGESRSGSLGIDQRPLVVKNMVFLPVPQRFEGFIVPSSNVVRFTVQHQIMGIQEPEVHDAASVAAS